MKFFTCLVSPTRKRGRSLLPSPVRFEVFINDEKVCTAGIGVFGVLTAQVTWVSHRPEKLARWQAQGITDLVPTELSVNVSGGISGDEQELEHWKWVNDDLSVGDEVRIRIIESIASDPPETRHHDDPTEDLERKKEYVLKMVKELGWEIRTGDSGSQQKK